MLRPYMIYSSVQTSILYISIFYVGSRMKYTSAFKPDFENRKLEMGSSRTSPCMSY